MNLRFILSKLMRQAQFISLLNTLTCYQFNKLTTHNQPFIESTLIDVKINNNRSIVLFCFLCVLIVKQHKKETNSKCLKIKSVG